MTRAFARTPVEKIERCTSTKELDGLMWGFRHAGVELDQKAADTAKTRRAELARWEASGFKGRI